MEAKTDSDPAHQQVPGIEADGKIELREGYAGAGDVKLNYVEAGDGPMVVLLHGFPEFWFGWRLQIAPLASAARIASSTVGVSLLGRAIARPPTARARPRSRPRR